MDEAIEPKIQIYWVLPKAPSPTLVAGLESPSIKESAHLHHVI